MAVEAKPVMNMDVQQLASILKGETRQVRYWQNLLTVMMISISGIDKLQIEG